MPKFMFSDARSEVSDTSWSIFALEKRLYIVSAAWTVS